VRRRTLATPEYDEWLSWHGIKERHRDLMIETVWRDPTIRDLALALEDTTTDRDWLRDRVRTAGYQDVDAERLTDALTQRATKSVRERVRASAVGAYAQGVLSADEFDGVLTSLGFSAAQLGFERQSADLQRRRDVVNDALATYRRQYVNDVIEEADYRLAITALGVDPERIDLIVADANAARAPQIAAEEDRQVKAAIREVQTQLVPRVRRLFDLGLISEQTYRDTLTQAGVGEQVAAQAVSLDAARVRAVISQRAAAEVARAVELVADERRDLYVEMFRKGLVTESQLRQALLDTGLARDLAELIVAREVVRKVPAPKPSTG
jgi:protein-disulfide isomerase